MENDFEKKIGQQNFSALATLYGNKVVIALQTGYSVGMGVCVCVCMRPHECMNVHVCFCMSVCVRERE